MILLIAAVVFVAGCASQPTNTTTYKMVEEHPDQSKEWIKTTSEDALNVSVAANDLMDVSLKGTDTQRITALMIYTEEEANNSSYESAQYYLHDDLEPASQKYAEMMGSYGAVAKRLKLTYEHLNVGDTTSAQITFKDAQESLERGSVHYAEYKAMVEDFKKKHPEAA